MRFCIFVSKYLFLSWTWFAFSGELKEFLTNELISFGLACSSSSSLRICAFRFWNSYSEELSSLRSCCFKVNTKILPVHKPAIPGFRLSVLVVEPFFSRSRLPDLVIFGFFQAQGAFARDQG
jgi:hypothetical protein